MVSKGFPNVTTSGRQYNIGEKPSVILYTYINFYMQGHQNHNPFYLKVLDYTVVCRCYYYAIHRDVGWLVAADVSINPL